MNALPPHAVNGVEVGGAVGYISCAALAVVIFLSSFHNSLGRHDDQVDALNQYLGWVRRKSGGGKWRIRMV